MYIVVWLFYEWFGYEGGFEFVFVGDVGYKVVQQYYVICSEQWIVFMMQIEFELIGGCFGDGGIGWDVLCFIGFVQIVDYWKKGFQIGECIYVLVGGFEMG